ncbi:MAG: response regulator [Paucibacter sp.]|nr:response regulator [Roseateles sp.]
MNAWEALRGEKGQIVIGLARVHIDAVTARMDGLAAGSYAHLWVRDTGAGMDASVLKKIFEPFSTTQSPGQGTGLGLSVVHKIVASHHGSISVDSQVGAGSTFHIHLPAISPTPVLPPPPEPPPEPPPLEEAAHSEYVVYLDDDETAMLLMVRILEKAGYRCSGFLDAAKVLALLQDKSLRVDVLITDYNMPVLSGLEVAREVACIRPGLPIAICSGLVTDELLEEAQRLGVLAVIEKEDTFHEIVPQLARLLTTAKRPRP